MIIKQHSTIAKRFKIGAEEDTCGEVSSNQALISCPFYDSLNTLEKELCETYNILPEEYLNLKLKVNR